MLIFHGYILPTFIEAVPFMVRTLCAKFVAKITFNIIEQLPMTVARTMSTSSLIIVHQPRSMAHTTYNCNSASRTTYNYTPTVPERVARTTYNCTPTR
jgi:hypothetical protein